MSKGVYQHREGWHHTEDTRKKISMMAKGKVPSQETRRKLSIAHKGKHLSEEHKKKIGLNGFHYGMLGKHLSSESKLKISIANKGKNTWMKGKHPTKETLKKMSEAHKGKPGGMLGKHHSEETKLKLSLNHKGREVSSETRKKISKALKGKLQPWNRGSNNWNWGKPSFNRGKPMSEEQKEKLRQTHRKRWENKTKVVHRPKHGHWRYREWRRLVFERDNYICQNCGTRGGVLNADHIKRWVHYPELRYELSNGRILCSTCHKKTDNYGTKGITKEVRKVFQGLSEKRNIKKEPPPFKK